MASGRAFPGKTRPLCPYPKGARFDGGNADDHAMIFVGSGMTGAINLLVGLLFLTGALTKILVAMSLL